MNSLTEVRLQNGKIIRHVNLKYSIKIEEIIIGIESIEKEEEHIIRVYYN